MLSAKWNLDFSKTDGITTVKISIKHEKLADIEMQIEMGFKNRLNMTLIYLSELLGSLNNTTVKQK